MAEKKADITVSEYLEAVRSKCTIKPLTRTGYETCFRRIVADICSIYAGSKYGGPGRDLWLSKVNAVKLIKITPDKVKDWQTAYLNRAGLDPLSQRRAKTSCNTTIRQARSLFSKKILKAVSAVVTLPSPLPFDGIEYEPRQSLKYTSQIDLSAAIQGRIRSTFGAST